MPIDKKEYDIALSGSRWDQLAFRVEHWLLSPGTSDMAQLRGYLRVKQWRDRTSRRERLHELKVLAKRPARLLRTSWQAYHTYGTEVTREHGVSRARQVLQLWWVSLRHGIEPAAYYSYRLYAPGQLRRAPSFFQTDEATRLYRLLSVRTRPDVAEMLLDKAQFERWLVSQRLPTARTALELAGGEVVYASEPHGGLPRLPLFSKPTDSYKGLGTMRWAYAEGADGEPGWTGEDGRRRTEAELVAEFKEQSVAHGGLLVQEQLRNHPALAPIAPKALSTVRVLTLRELDGRVHVVLAVAKVPAGDAPTDHMRLGGIAAPVDLATGRLGEGVRKHKTKFTEPCSVHPDTGTAIEGFQLPCWEEVKALAVRAHEALGEMVCIGWDVAILQRGPVIIEANDNPGAASSQMPTGIPIGETPVVRTLAARLHASFTTSVPG